MSILTSVYVTSTLVMGAERRVVYDLINVVQGVVKLPQARIRVKRVDSCCRHLCCPRESLTRAIFRPYEDRRQSGCRNGASIASREF